MDGAQIIIILLAIFLIIFVTVIIVLVVMLVRLSLQIRSLMRSTELAVSSVTRSLVTIGNISGSIAAIKEVVKRVLPPKKKKGDDV